MLLNVVCPVLFGHWTLIRKIIQDILINAVWHNTVLIARLHTSSSPNCGGVVDDGVKGGYWFMAMTAKDSRSDKK